MELLAYHDPEKDRHQSLGEHVEGMLGIYEDLFVNGGWLAVASERTGIDERYLDLGAKLAIAFHDVGKAYYTDRIRRGYGAPLHEVYSTLVLDALKEFIIGELCLPLNVYKAVSWSVLIHHLSMRNPEIYGSGRLRVYALHRKAPLRVGVTEDIVKALRSMLYSVLRLDFPLHRLTGRILRLLDVAKTYVSLRGGLNEFYDVALRLSRILILTDNVDASMARGGRDKVFTRDLPSMDSLRTVRRVVGEWMGS